jgi:hypothetical protein
MITRRILPPEEYGRLKEAGGPLADVRPDPAHTKVNVVEENGQIVGYWPVFNAVHAEPLWIPESHRHRREVALALIAQVLETLQEYNVAAAFGVIADVDFVVNFPMAKKLGFSKAPGDLYFIIVPPVEQKESVA